MNNMIINVLDKDNKVDLFKLGHNTIKFIPNKVCIIKKLWLILKRMDRFFCIKE